MTPLLLIVGGLACIAVAAVGLVLQTYGLVRSWRDRAGPRRGTSRDG